MAGVKRSRDGRPSEKKPESDSPYIPMFETFKAELDEHHDRRERIIKASRDITAQSKKIIFALQRARKVGIPLPQSITKANEPMYSTIQTLFQSIEQDLKGINAHRYQRQVSGGIQEYTEAVLFQHYLENGKIMTHHDTASTIPGGLQLTHDDYILGLFDMTGELMRFAVTYLATNGSLPGADQVEHEPGRSSILTDMQLLRSHLETIDASSSYGLARDFEKKLQTTQTSVEKVEYGVYSMLVRGKERPRGWRPDDNEGTMDGNEVEAY